MGKKVAATKGGKTLADFRAKYDRDVVIANKIRAAFALMLESGPEEHEEQADFLKLAGITENDLKNVRDKFSDHLVETPNVKRDRAPFRIWFADPKVAALVRPKKPQHV